MTPSSSLDARSLVAPCPECTAPMIGHIGNGLFLPDSECPACGHAVPVLEVTSPFNRDLYTLDSTGAIAVTSDEGDDFNYASIDDPEWEDLNFFPLGRDSVALAVLACTNPGQLVDAICEDTCTPALVSIYKSLLEEVDPQDAPAVLRSLNPDALPALYEGCVVAVLDDLARDLNAEQTQHERNLGNRSPVSIRAHLTDVCYRLSLPAMVDVYLAINDRRRPAAVRVSAARLASRTDRQIRGDYERRIQAVLEQIRHAALNGRRVQRTAV